MSKFRDWWFFAHAGGNLPLSPCAHKHTSVAEAEVCARRKGLGTIRSVVCGVGVSDDPVRELAK